LPLVQYYFSQPTYNSSCL